MNEIYGHITHTISTTLSSHVTKPCSCISVDEYLLLEKRLLLTHKCTSCNSSTSEWSVTYIATSRVLRVRENPRLMDITDSSNTFFSSHCFQNGGCVFVVGNKELKADAWESRPWQGRTLCCQHCGPLGLWLGQTIADVVEGGVLGTAHYCSNAMN